MHKEAGSRVADDWIVENTHGRFYSFFDLRNPFFFCLFIHSLSLSLSVCISTYNTQTNQSIKPTTITCRWLIDPRGTIQKMSKSKAAGEEDRVSFAHDKVSLIFSANKWCTHIYISRRCRLLFSFFFSLSLSNHCPVLLSLYNLFL